MTSVQFFEKNTPLNVGHLPAPFPRHGTKSTCLHCWSVTLPPLVLLVPLFASDKNFTAVAALSLACFLIWMSFFNATLLLLSRYEFLSASHFSSDENFSGCSTFISLFLSMNGLLQCYLAMFDNVGFQLSIKKWVSNTWQENFRPRTWNDDLWKWQSMILFRRFINGIVSANIVWQSLTFLLGNITDWTVSINVVRRNFWQCVTPLCSL